MPSGPYTFNPSVWRNFNLTLSNKNFDNQMKEFQKQLADFASLIQQLLTANGVAAMLNGTAGLLASSISIKSVDLGTITANQTVDCAGAILVAVSLSVATAFNPTLTLTHLALGVPVTIVCVNNGGAGITLKVAASQPGGTAYTAVIWDISTGTINLTTTGIGVVAGGSRTACGSSTPFGANWTLLQVAN